MIKNQINFKFGRCNSSTNKKCKSDWEIDSYLQDMAIYTYSLKYTVDFSIYNTLPLFKSQQIKDILYPATLNKNQT